MGDKKKLILFISITIVLAIGGFVGVMFFAPEEGMNGFIFNLVKKAIFIVAAALIITAVIKHKSVTKTDKISKYIAIGVLLYAVIAGLAGFIGYLAFKDFKGTRSTATVNVADYDTYHTDYWKLGTLYYLNVTMDGKQTSFVITEDTYKAIKQVSQIEIEYYPNNNVIYSVGCSNSVSDASDSSNDNVANSVKNTASSVKNTVSSVANSAKDTVTSAVSGITGNSKDNTAEDDFE